MKGKVIEIKLDPTGKKRVTVANPAQKEGTFELVAVIFEDSPDYQVGDEVIVQTRRVGG